MVTVSHLTKRYVDETPFIHEALSKKVLNYGATAEILRPKIEKEMQTKVKLSSIVMALRRYGDEMVRKHDSKKIIAALSYDTEIGIKSGLFIITARKSKKLFGALGPLYALVDYEKGDMLNIIHGNLTVSIISNEKHKNEILDFLKNEEIIHVGENLSQVSIVFPEEFRYTPGVLYMLTKQLLWHNVNLVETVSASTELDFVVKKEDALKTYGALEELMEMAKKSKK